MAETNDDNLTARVDYLVGIAERDEMELQTLQKCQQQSEESYEEFSAWKEAKDQAAELEKMQQVESFHDSFLEYQASAKERQLRKSAITAEQEDIRCEKLAWVEAERSMTTENKRQQITSLREASKARQKTKENENLNQSKEKESLREMREDKRAWVTAKENYKTEEISNERKDLIERARKKEVEKEKQRMKEKRKKEAEEKRKSEQAKFDMLRKQRSYNREEARKYLADRNAERVISVKLKLEEKRNEIKRKQVEREIARAEARAAKERKLKQIATDSRRLRTKNELTMKAKRDADLLKARQRREELQKSRDAAKMDQLSMEKHKNERKNMTQSHLHSLEQKIQETRKLLAAEKSKMVGKKYGVKRAAKISHATSPAGKPSYLFFGKSMWYFF
jgi:hypothetical protein